MEARQTISLRIPTPRAGFIILATACAAFGMLVATWSLLRQAGDDRVQMKAHARAAARADTQILNREVASIEALLAGLAVSPALQTDDLASFHRQASTVAKPAGSFILLYDRNRGMADLDGILVNTNLPFGVATPPQLSTTKAAVNEVVRKVVASRQTQLSDIVFARLANADVVAVCIPIFREDMVHYVLCAALPPPGAMRLLAVELPPEWFSGIFDSEGNVVTMRPSQDGTAYVPRLGAARSKLVADSDVAFDAFALDGEPLYVAASALSVSGWTVVAAIPYTVLDAPVNRAIIFSAGAGGLLLLLSIGVTIVAAPRITRPLRSRIAEDEERFAMMAAAVPSTLFTATPDGRCSYVSERFFAYTGLPAGAAEGFGWMDVLHPEDRKRVVLKLAQPVTGINRSDIELRLRGASGSYRWFVAHSVPVSNAAGNVVKWFGTITDIDDLKRAEVALRRLSIQLLKSQDDAQRRIAREIHDTTVQTLAAASMQIDQLRTGFISSGRAFGMALDEVHALILHSVEELRTLAYLLHPPMFDELGFVSAVRWFARGFERRSGVRVAVTAPENVPRFPADIETALFRVVQEGLSNIHRHSGSRECQITVMHHPQTIGLEITDDGVGMPGSAGFERNGDEVSFGVGIPGMRLRLEQLGGSLEIVSNGFGTNLRATVPQPMSSPHADAPVPMSILASGFVSD